MTGVVRFVETKEQDESWNAEDLYSTTIIKYKNGVLYKFCIVINDEVKNERYRSIFNFKRNCFRISYRDFGSETINMYENGKLTTISKGLFPGEESYEQMLHVDIRKGFTNDGYHINLLNNSVLNNDSPDLPLDYNPLDYQTVEEYRAKDRVKNRIVCSGEESQAEY